MPWRSAEINRVWDQEPFNTALCHPTIFTRLPALVCRHGVAPTTSSGPREPRLYYHHCTGLPLSPRPGISWYVALWGTVSLPPA